MACGGTLTLKRSMEFDPVHSQVAKRQRCMASAMSSQAASRRRLQAAPSPFAGVVPKLESDAVSARIGLEIKYLQHQQRAVSSASASSEHGVCHSGPRSSDGTAAVLPALSSLGLPCSTQQSYDVPLLSLRQVGLICERMLKEREDQLSEEYGRILNDKLTEQYEAFLKFNYDQINRRFGEAVASYVS